MVLYPGSTKIRQNTLGGNMNALKYIAGKLFSNDKEVLTEDSIVKW